MNSPVCKAFTLIELLTVIAIIGVLAGILIPTLGAVRESAHRSTCQSNLRQLAMAGRLYTQDHRGQFPSTTLWNNNNNSKPGVLDYLGSVGAGARNLQVYRCPRLQDGYPIADNVSQNTYSASLATSSNANGGTFALNYIDRVQSPSRTAWIMDGQWQGTYFSTVISVNALAADIPRLQFPHKGSQQVVFVDGHVESFSRDKFPSDPTLPFWTGQ